MKVTGTQSIPNVSRADVLRIVRRDFSLTDEERILLMLSAYGTEKWHYEVDRVHLAILKLARGDIDRLKENIDVAKSDFRDVVAPAESPGFWKIGFVGVDKLSPKQVEKLLADDWRQYSAWLEQVPDPSQMRFPWLGS